MNSKERTLFRKSLRTLGYDLQELILIEECGEVVQAVTKLRRKGTDKELINLLEELVDLRIMLEQIELWYRDRNMGNFIDGFREEKLKRLEGLIKGDR